MQIWQVLDGLESGKVSQDILATHGPIKHVLSLAQPNIIWFLPEGAPDSPEFKGLPSQQAKTTLAWELKRLKVFHSDPSGKDMYPHLKKLKREGMFVEMLADLPEQEVRLIVAIKDKTVYNEFPLLKNDK